MRLNDVWLRGLCLVSLGCAVACGGDNKPGPMLDGGLSDGAMEDASMEDASMDATMTDASMTDAAVDANDDLDAEVPDLDASDANMPDAEVDAGGIPGIDYRKPAVVTANSEFARSMATSGDTAVVGAPGDANGGAAYVFVYDGTRWTQQARIVARNHEGVDRFGGSVAIDGNTIVVGATGERSNSTGVNGDETNNAFSNAGAAYVFTRNGQTWTQQAYLKASNTGGNDNFGYAVSVSGDTVAVSAHTEASSAIGINGDQSSNSTTFSGAVYVFSRTGITWAQQAYLKASNTGQFDRFGVALDLDGDTLAVGAYYEDSAAAGIDGDQSDNSASDSGAVYVFVRDAAVWSQQAFVKASNVGAGDWFGGSVAMEGDRLVVGARREDGLATDETSDAAMDSGAAYVFARDGVTWMQVAYLKPSVSDPGDAFGTMVTLHAGDVAVGASDEDSAGVFPEPDPLDNAAAESGAAYIFTFDNDTYTETHYLKASNTGTEDRFGSAIGFGTMQILIGAFSERSANGNPRDNSAENAGAFYAYDLP